MLKLIPRITCHYDEFPKILHFTNTKIGPLIRLLIDTSIQLSTCGPRCCPISIKLIYFGSTLTNVCAIVMYLNFTSIKTNLLNITDHVLLM